MFAMFFLNIFDAVTELIFIEMFNIVNDKIRLNEKWKIKIYKYVHEFGILLFAGGIPKMKNLLCQISIIKAMEIKPNFSELAREYEIDRRTIKKYYEGYEDKAKTRNK